MGCRRSGGRWRGEMLKNVEQGSGRQADCYAAAPKVAFRCLDWQTTKVSSSRPSKKLAALPVAIDLFCGAGGLTRGLLDAGIHVAAGYDVDRRCRFPYEYNNPPA